VLLRKLAVLLMVVAATLVLASGVALAADFIGTSGNDELTGTEGNDYLEGRAGADRLYGLGGTMISTGTWHR
jgi:Ca2+-binding RTX toxin-like protein